MTAGVLWFVYPLNTWTYAAVVAVVFGVGVWACGRMEKLYGHDPSAAVIDEVCGMTIALAGAPIHVATVLLGFLFFRVFDVLKIAPGSYAERLPGGWGVMMDDVVAGVYYAFVALHLVLRVWPEPRLEVWHGVALAVLALFLFALRKPLMRRYGKPRTRIHHTKRGA